MAVVNVSKRDGVETWVSKTNSIAIGVGDTAGLTGAASDVVNGVNLLDGAIGDLSQLITPDQSNLVAAVNDTKNAAIRMALVLATPIN